MEHSELDWLPEDGVVLRAGDYRSRRRGFRFLLRLAALAETCTVINGRARLSARPLTRTDLTTIFVALRALIDGTAPLEANRSHAVDIAVTITHALERGGH